MATGQGRGGLTVSRPPRGATAARVGAYIGGAGYCCSVTALAAPGAPAPTAAPSRSEDPAAPGHSSPGLPVAGGRPRLATATATALAKPGGNSRRVTRATRVGDAGPAAAAAGRPHGGKAAGHTRRSGDRPGREDARRGTSPAYAGCSTSDLEPGPAAGLGADRNPTRDG